MLEVSRKNKNWSRNLKTNSFRIFKENVNDQYLPGRLIELQNFLDLCIVEIPAQVQNKAKAVWIVEIIS